MNVKDKKISIIWNKLAKSNPHLNINILAKGTHLPKYIITNILNGTQRITADISIRLGLFLNISTSYFLNLQARADIKEALLQHKVQYDKIQPYK